MKRHPLIGRLSGDGGGGASLSTTAGRVRLLAVGAALGATLMACQLLVGAGDEEGSPPPSQVPAPGPEAGDAAPVDLCQHVVPPPPSLAPDGADAPPIWFAVSSLEGLPRVDARPFGLDQDGLCTGFLGATDQDGGAPCLRAVVDDRGGIDNAAARMFVALPDGGGIQLFRGFTRSLRLGERTLLIGLSRYNGAADDPAVEVRFATSGALETNACDLGDAGDAGDGGGGPRSEGCDTWSRARAAAGGDPDAGGPETLLEGYVVGGRLVAGTRRPSTLTLDVLDVSLSVLHARFVATLTERSVAGRRVRSLDGVVAGRLSPSALLEELGREPGLCTTATMRSLRAAVCDYRDIPSAPEDDRAPGKACSSVSIGLALVASEALLGAEVAARPVGVACDAGETTCD
ncbi:MAG: hypothetical protein IPF92_23060 [Myxococcales bacterium]|nr:hypothetical protein [Myxococcales bacterium]